MTTDLVKIPEWLGNALDKYGSELNHAALETKFSNIKSGLDQKQEHVQLSQQALQLKVTDLLNSLGSPTFLNVPYCAYSLELDRIYRKFNPAVWAWPTDYTRELHIAALKWKAAGLNIDNLVAIAKMMLIPEIEPFLRS